MSESEKPSTSANEAEGPEKQANDADVITGDRPKPETDEDLKTSVEGTTGGGASGGPQWPDIRDDAPLRKLIERLPELVREADYDEMYGIKLTQEFAFQRNLILQKFLRANYNDVEKAEAQLKDALKWRKEFQPLSLPSQVFSKEKFGGLAYVSSLSDVPDSNNKRDVACWNIYGAVTDNAVTFGDLDAFTKWRVAVMEAALAKLMLQEATQPIPDYNEGPDPYQMIQVHDYKNVSFLRQDPNQKAAAKKAIEIFGAYYPETLSRKMFVNVPSIMGWMFSAMKMILSKETVRKFTVISNGKDLVGELGISVPQEYGGNGEGLDKAEELKME